MYLFPCLIIGCRIISMTGTLAPESSSSRESEEITNVPVESEDDLSGKTPLKIYQMFFSRKRKEQWEAVKQIQSHPIEKRDRLISALVVGMEHAFKDAKFVIDNAGYKPGSPYPDDNVPDLKEAVAKTLENTAFFADLALHFPNTVAKLYKRDNELKSLLVWAITFSNATKFYDEKTTKLMHLVGQELGLVDRDPAYFNPYLTPSDSRPDPAVIDEMEKIRLQKIEKERKAKKEAKRKKQKGPRLQGGSRTEL